MLEQRVEGGRDQTYLGKIRSNVMQMELGIVLGEWVAFLKMRFIKEATKMKTPERTCLV